MNKNLIYGIVAVVALGAAAFFFIGGGENQVSSPPAVQGNAVATQQAPTPAPAPEAPAGRAAGRGSSGPGRLTASQPQVEETEEQVEGEPVAKGRSRSTRRLPRTSRNKKKASNELEIQEDARKEKKPKAKRF